jgi:hypothetical protein
MHTCHSERIQLTIAGGLLCTCHEVVRLVKVVVVVLKFRGPATDKRDFSVSRAE